MKRATSHFLYRWLLFLTLTLLWTVMSRDIIGEKESRRPGYSENIEGCFSNFSAEVEETISDMNNLVCQSLCVDRGYILSATTAPSRCLCGNLYPSAFYRLDKVFCSNPCRAEHSDCFGFTCCGSTDGRYYTVSFSGKVNIVKQVLRRLSYDYRRDNMYFRSKIEGFLAHSTSLKAWRGRGRQEEALGFLAMLDGCPDDQWVAWRTSCYKLHKDPSMGFQKASSTCEHEEAVIVSPESEEESQLIKKMYEGCHGWIEATRCGHGNHWQAVMFQNWESQETIDECHAHNRKTFAISSKEAPTLSACARLAGVNGTWYLTGCRQKHDKSAFVCEKPYFSLDLPRKMCPPPWEIHGDICLLLSQSYNVTWYEARETCRLLGAYLVSITSKKKNQIVKDLLGNRDGFIGLHQSHSKKWSWDSFTLSSDIDMEETTESAVCLEMAKNKSWDRIECQKPETRLIICKARGKQCSCPLGWIQKACFCYHEELRTHVTWIQAKEICRSLDSEVVWISSNEENDFIHYRLSRHLLFNGTVRTFIQRNEGHLHRQLSEANTDIFHTFGKNCLRLHPRGFWKSVSCSSKSFASCSLCKKPRGVPRPYLQQVDVHPRGKWALEVVQEPFRTEDMKTCPGCKLVRLIDVDSSLYIAAEKDYGELYFTSSPGEGMCESTFMLVIENHSGRFTLLSYPHGAPLIYQESKFRFDSTRIGKPIYEDGNAVWFEPSDLLSIVARDHLRISISPLSRDLSIPGFRECSMSVGDRSPDSSSYRCDILDSDNSFRRSREMVYFEQQALLIFDRSTFLTPRRPLRLGRTRCENLTPYEAPCSFGYGETVAVTKNFVAHWGYTLSDDMLSLVSATVQENLDFPASGFPTSGNDGQDGSSGDGQDGNFGSNGEGSFSDTNTLSFSNQAYAELNNFLSLAFNNFYEFILTRDYIEARGYSVTVPVKPTSSLEYQTWVSTTHIRYRWRVIIGARGGLIISAFGRPIGDLHSLSDLSYYEDLFFNLYGTYEYPLTAEIVFTMDKDLGASWPLNLESESIGDRVRSVARNGQFGYR